MSAKSTRKDGPAQETISRDPLLARWLETLALAGGAAAIVDTRGATLRTFREIEEQARCFESRIDKFAAGQVVAVQIGNHPDWPSLLLAGLRRGVVVIPLETSIGQREREIALEICRAASVVAAVPGRTVLEITPLRTAASTEEIAWGGLVPSFLKLTSGTTARPRAIRFRSDQLLADCDNICETMGITGADLNFGVVPVSHSYGFSNLLTPLIARGIPMVLSRDRLPRAVLEDLVRTRATVFPGMPVFYQAFCEMSDVPPLPDLRLSISAGAPLPAAVSRMFHEKFGQPIHSFYGSSECGGICYDRAGLGRADGFVGSPLKGVDLERLDPQAESSQVRVRSAAVGDGYFPEPDKAKLGAGAFIPDDLLSQEDSGFRIVGRISDLINVAGKKVNPAEVEAHLLTLAGVRQAIVFGRKSSRRNEEVAACVVAESNLAESDLLKFCRERLSGWQVPKRIFMVDQIPVNERGKTSRRELGRRFADL